MLLSDNGVSKVWKDGLWVYKRQPKFMTDNEIWCLKKMWESGYVPFAEQIEIELIRMRILRSEIITDKDLFMFHVGPLLEAMEQAGIRHGDLTSPHIIPIKNRPRIIDWGESRVMCDPRESKRPEGDEYWLTKSMNEIASKDHWLTPLREDSTTKTNMVQSQSTKST